MRAILAGKNQFAGSEHVTFEIIRSDVLPAFTRFHVGNGHMRVVAWVGIRAFNVSGNQFVQPHQFGTDHLDLDHIEAIATALVFRAIRRKQGNATQANGKGSESGNQFPHFIRAVRMQSVLAGHMNRGFPAVRSEFLVGDGPTERPHLVRQFRG